MIETTIRCDHCHMIIDENGYRIANLKIDPQKGFLEKELELCPKCAIKLREQIMDFILPKHYKY